MSNQSSINTKITVIHSIVHICYTEVINTKYCVIYPCAFYFRDRKIRFLHLESFGDLAPYMWGSLRFYITVFMFAFTFWLRLYVHYIAQFLYLQVFNLLKSDFIDFSSRHALPFDFIVCRC